MHGAQLAAANTTSPKESKSNFVLRKRHEYDINMYPTKWVMDDILTHQRTVITSALGANGSAMWDLRRRFRDPSTREVPSFTLPDTQFLLAARMQLGIGLAGVVEGGLQDGARCTACKKGLQDRCGFHSLYSCQAQQGNRTKRHTALQRIYENLARSAGLDVSHYAPNVTSSSNSNNHSHSKNMSLQTGRSATKVPPLFSTTLT